MDRLKLLDKVHKALESQEIECRLFPFAEDTPLPFVGINVGRDKLMTIYILDQEMGEGLDSPMADPQLVIFELELPFSFEVDPLHARDVGSLLHFLNRQVKMPGFQFDEAANRVFFRYDVITAPAGITDLLIVSLVGMARLYSDLYGRMIEEIALGRLTFSELMVQVAGIMEQLE